MKFFYRFHDDVRGSIAIEYVLIATLVSTAIIVGALAIGTNLGEIFSNLGPSIG